MSLSALCRSVRSRWQALTQLVWPEGSEQRTQDEIARLTTELARCYDRLVLRRQRIEQLRDRLARQERELTLSTEVNEPLRHTVERNRLRLTNLQQRYTRLHQSFLKRKRLHRALLRGQVVVCADPSPGTDD